MPVRFVLALVSLVVGSLSVAFYANGQAVVALILAIGAVAIGIPYIRERHRKRRMSGAIL